MRFLKSAPNSINDNFENHLTRRFTRILEQILSKKGLVDCMYKYLLTWYAASFLLIFSDRALPFYYFFFIERNCDVILTTAIILICTGSFHKYCTVAGRASLINSF